jgi:hypothetical protein
VSSFSRLRLLADDGTRWPHVRVSGRLPGRGWLAAGVVVLFVLASAPSALADRSFTTRFNADVPGNITMAANTLMVCPAAAAGCTAARSAPPIASGSNNAINNNNNNNYNMVYVTTGPPGTVAGAAIFDSSSATLALPATATVLFAGCIGVRIRARAQLSPLVGRLRMPRRAARRRHLRGARPMLWGCRFRGLPGTRR